MKFVLILFSFLISFHLNSCAVPAKGQEEELHSCPIPSESEILSEVCANNMDCSYKTYPYASLVIEEYDTQVGSSSRDEGKYEVFEIDRKYRDDPMIADDEYREVLKFQIPQDKEAFTLRGADFKEAKAIFGTLAFSRDGGYYYVKDGCLEGKKLLDNQWQVKGHIQVVTRSGREIIKYYNATFN